jgi:hypothetical protein
VLVYGDRTERADLNERTAALARRIDHVGTMVAGIDRHAALVAILIEAGQLLQGLADAEFAERGEDSRTAVADELGEFVLQLARAVCRSWASGFDAIGQIPAAPALDAGPRDIELRTPEGFAFYAVYPEAYIEAARRLSLVAPPRVIGIRSIGTTLAALVAAALGAPAPVTIRPHGDPFARQLAIAPRLERELLAGSAHYIIVDEGPGLSGSSFGSVADWLQERGIPLERIAFVPSHAGAPGPHASDAHRRRWSHAQRMPAQFDDLPHLLGDWVSPLIGKIDRSLIEVSGGEWRKLRYSCEEQWPAVNPAWERRKFLANKDGERFLIKFAGLGSIGGHKLCMARKLYAAGLMPEPLGLVHGFLVERWCEDARPLTQGDKPVAQIARYIGARVRLFPATRSGGASLLDLLEMSRRNVSLALGGGVARLLDDYDVGELSRRVVRSCTDNRLLPHEWLRSSDRVLKTDALDHHVGHDLVGCQDMAWDIAGAIVEFELNSGEAAELVNLAAHSGGRDVDRELLDFYRVAYLAFRVGQTAMSVQDRSANEAESARLKQEENRYGRALEQLLLESTPGRTPPISLVG